MVAQLITHLGGTLGVATVVGGDDRPLLCEAASGRGAGPTGTACHKRHTVVKSSSAVVSRKARGGLKRAEDWRVG